MVKKISKADALAADRSKSDVDPIGPPKDKPLVSIGQAAQILGVSVDTVRRWDSDGVLHSQRPDGKNRYFNLEELEKVKFSAPLSISEAAEHLSISPSTLRRLEEKGMIKPERNAAGERIYDRRTLEKFLHSDYFIRQREIEEEILEPLHGNRLTAENVNQQVHSRDKIAHLVLGEHQIELERLKRFHKISRLSLAVLFSSFALLVSVITLLFLLFPEATAATLGYYQRAPKSSKYTFEPQNSLLARQLKPFTQVSLAVVERINPSLRSKVAPFPSIPNVNDVFAPDEEGNITSLYSFTVPDSSYLKIPDTGLVANLNSDLLRGYVPGHNPGNLAILPVEGGAGGSIRDKSITGADIADKTITVQQLADGISLGGETIINNTTTGVSDVTAGDGLTGGGTGVVTLNIVGGGGLSVAADSINLDTVTTGTTTTIASNSGLEVTSDGLRLIGGCSDTQILKWNGTAGQWECSADSGGAGSSLTVRESDGSPSGSATTLEFGPAAASSDEFVVTSQGGGVMRVRLGSSVFTSANYSTTLDGVYVNAGESPVAGDITGSFSGGLSVGANSVALGTDTTGNYQAATVAGSGISVSGSAAEGWTATVALGDLTANWTQAAAFDIVLNNANSELRILENGATPIFFGALDVGDLTADATYTLSGASGTVLTSANYAGSLDVTYVNVGESPAAGDITGSFSGGLNVSANSVALTTDTTGDYVAGLTAGAGLTGDASGEGSTPTLAIGQGSGITVSADAIAVATQANKGLEVDSNGVALIDCGDNQILKYSTGTSAWACAPDVDTDTHGNAFTTFATTSGTSPAADSSTDTLTLNAGSGVSVTGNSTNDAIDFALAALTADWNQTGAFDIVLGHTDSELKILEGGATPSFYGTLDVDDLSGAATYTLSGASGTLLSSANYSSTLDSIYVNASESPAAGDISGSFSGGLTVNANSVALGTDTTGDYVASFTAGNGLTGDATGEGSTPTLAVGGGDGITVSADGLAVDAVTSGVTAATSSNSGIEATSTGIRLLGGCSGGQILKWNSTISVWECNTDATGGGGANSFETIATASGTSPVADSATDTLTFATGNGVTTVGDATADSITLNLAALTADWNQTGAFDIVLGNSSSELKILEAGASPSFYGTIDVDDLSGAATYTFSGASGTVLSNANYSTTLDSVYVNVGESPAAGDISGSFSGGLTLNANSVALGTDTTGDYVASFTAGNGLTGDASGEGSTPTLAVGGGSGISVAADGVALGALTADWNQTGAFDIVLGHTDSELKILEGGATPSFYGTLDVDDLSGAATYTLSGASGTLLSSANYSSTLDSIYVNASESPAAGDIGGSFTGGLTVNANSVALGTDTTNDYVAGLTAGSGLTGDASGEGSSPTLAIGQGNGITVSADAIAVATQANKGLEVDSNGVSLIDCGDNQILKYSTSTNQWSCQTDATGGGSGNSFETIATASGTSPVADSATDTLTFTGGNGITTVGDATADSIALNLTALTADWNQTGAFDIVLGHTDSELKILEGGATPSFYGTLDVDDLSGSATYTLSGASGTLLSSANYSSTLDSIYVNVGESPAAGDIGGSFSGGLTVNANSVALGTDTTNDYVASFTAGNGLTGDASGEGSTPTLAVGGGSGISVAADGVALGALTADWNQTGAFDIVLGHTDSELKILESGASPSFYGTIDVDDLSGAATYTFSGASGTVLSSANYSTTLDSIYVNAGESPAAGDISGSFTAGLTIGANSVALGTDTTGDYVASFTAGNGLTGDATGEGSIPTLAVGGGNGIAVAADGVALGALTSDWNQTGAFDIILNNSDSQFSILENGATPSFYGTLDVDDLSGAATYTLSGASGTLLSSANYSTTLDSIYVNAGESPAAGDIGGSFSGGLTVNANSVALGTDTTGDYVASFTAGNGLTGDATGEGSTPTLAVGGGSGISVAADGVALGALTADWNQTGAFDIVLGHTDSELKILEGGATPSFYGTLDVDDLSGAATYTLSGASGTLLSSANYSSTLDSIYVNVGESPAAGDIGGSFSGGLTIGANSVALTTDTTGDYVASFTAGNGLTGDASGEGSTPTLAVASANGGIVVNANDIALTLQANKGLEVDANGLSLIDCANNEILKYSTGTSTWSCQTDATGAGGTAWSGLTAPTADLTLAHADFSTSFSFDTSTDALRNYFGLSITNDLATDTTQQRLFSLTNNDDGATTTGTTDALLYFNNADVGEAVTAAIQIANTGGGGYTNFLDTPTLDISGAGAITGATGVSTTTLDASGLATFTGGITANDSDADTFLIGQNGATPDTVTIAGNVSLTDTDWSLSATGTATLADIVCNSASCISSGEVTDNTLNFVDFSDTLALDANTSIAQDGTETLTFANSGSGNIIFDLQSTGDLTFRDNSSTFLTLSDTGAYDYTLDSTDNPAYIITNNGSGGIITNLAGTGDFVIQDGGAAFVTFSNTGTLTIDGAAVFNGGITANDTSADTFLIGQNGATDDIVTIAGDVSIADDQWGITAAGTGTFVDIICTDCLDFGELADALALDANTSIAQSDAETLTFTNGGSGNLVVDLTSTGDFVIADGGVSFVTFADGGQMTINSGGLTVSSGTVVIGTGSNKFTFDPTTGPLYEGTARPTKRIYLAAEFAGASITGDGGGNVGTMTSDNEAASPFRNYYNWTSTTAGNDYDIWIKAVVPDDFSAWDGIGTGTAYGTAAGDDVVVQVYGTDNASACSSDIATAAGWNSNASLCNYTAGTFAAGSTFTIKVTLRVNTASNHARISSLNLPYKAKF